MNPLPPNADELVSAYLDGHAAPDEIAIVESSPELMERVEALRSVADLLAAPAAPPAGQKEAHISAALDAFDALFAAEDTITADTPEPIALHATPPAEAAPAKESDQERPEQPALVTSLSQERERRRPRRFNTGVIAAAAAAMLLFVAIAAFGFGGGGGDDVATSAASDAVEAGADFAADAGDAMDDSDEAMANSAGSNLSSVPAPTAAPPEAARAESAELMAEDAADAMAEEEAMDDEEAMADDEDAMADDATDDTFEVEADQEAAAQEESEPAAGGVDSDPTFLFGDRSFSDVDSLLLELDQVVVDDIERLTLFREPGLFPGCQAEVDVLSASETPTFIGRTFVQETPVEIHQLANETGEIEFVIVNETDCVILSPAS